MAVSQNSVIQQAPAKLASPRQISGVIATILNIVGAVLLVAVLDLFSPLHSENLRLMPDQDFFQLTGKVWAEGGVPYRDIWDQKGPFIFFVNMLGWKLTGNGTGIVIIECLFLLATMALLWLMISAISTEYGQRIAIGKKNDESSAGQGQSAITNSLIMWVCILWIAICLPGSWNMTELFCLPFLAASAWLTLRSLYAYQSQSDLDSWHIPTGWAYVHGLAFGVCFMTRLSNAAGVCVSVLVLTVLLIMRRRWTNLGLCVLGFAAGTATFFVPFAVYFAYHGVFGEFMYGTVLYNLQYANGLSASANLPGVTTLLLVFMVPGAMLLAGLAQMMRERSIHPDAVLMVGCSVVFSALFFQMFAIQTGSYLHYTIIDVALLPMVLVPLAGFIRNQYARIAALICIAAVLLGYAGLRTRQVMTWPNYDNFWVSELVQQSQGSIAFYNMNSLAYTTNDVAPAYPYAAFQDWQAEFSDDMRNKIVDSYTQPRTKLLVVQQYGDLTPVIQHTLDSRYRLVDTVSDQSGTYTIYQRL